MKLNHLHESEYKAAVAIVYDDHANVLVGKATHNDDRKGKWCFPGGQIDAGERPEDAAVRECEEETGLTVVAQQPAFGHKSKPNAAFVVCRYLSGEFNPNSEFSELKWVPWKDLINLEDFFQPNVDILQVASSHFP